MRPLSQDERRMLADLLGRDAAEQAGIAETKAQAELRRQIDESRQKPNPWQQQIEQDELPYISGHRGQRRTIQLSPEDIAPKPNPMPQPILQPQPQPEPEITIELIFRTIVAKIRRKLWAWSTH